MNASQYNQTTQIVALLNCCTEANKMHHMFSSFIFCEANVLPNIDQSPIGIHHQISPTLKCKLFGKNRFPSWWTTWKLNTDKTADLDRWRPVPYFLDAEFSTYFSGQIWISFQISQLHAFAPELTQLLTSTISVAIYLNAHDSRLENRCHVR